MQGERSSGPSRPPRRQRLVADAKPRILRAPMRVAATASRDRLTRASMVGVETWACQLQDVKIADIAACPADLCVVDSSPDGSPELAFTRDQVERMQGLDGGRRKRVLCYMSVGEADERRFYWDDGWIAAGGIASGAPGWLGGACASGWAGNHSVRYWDRDWHDIVVDRSDSCLNRIIDAGFDGVCIDGMDSYEFWSDPARGAEQRPTAAADMVDLVARIAEHAWNKRGRSRFLVVPQNGEGLLEHDRFRAAISAIGKEDLLYAMEVAAEGAPGVRSRSDAEFGSIMRYLTLAKGDGIPVIAIEYLMDRPADRRKIEAAAARLRQLGVVPHFGLRNLHRLSPTVGPGVTDDAMVRAKGGTAS